MAGKFATLKHLIDVRRDYLARYGSQNKKFYRKIIISYFVDCILCNKDSFSISYGQRKEKEQTPDGVKKVPVYEFADEGIMYDFLEDIGFSMISEDLNFGSVVYFISCRN